LSSPSDNPRRLPMPPTDEVVKSVLALCSAPWARRGWEGKLLTVWRHRLLVAWKRQTPDLANAVNLLYWGLYAGWPHTDPQWDTMRALAKEIPSDHATP